MKHQLSFFTYHLAFVDSLVVFFLKYLCSRFWKFHSEVFGYRLVPRLESAQPRAEAAQRRLPQRGGLRGAEAAVPPPRPGRHRRETHGLLHVERQTLRNAQLLHLRETAERRRFVVALSFLHCFTKSLPFRVNTRWHMENGQILTALHSSYFL